MHIKGEKTMTEASWIVTIKHGTFKTRTYIFDDLKQAFDYIDFIISTNKQNNICRITLKKWNVKA